MTNVMGKCCAATASAMNGMKRSMKNCRRDGDIVDQQKRIDDLTREIGAITVVKLDQRGSALDAQGAPAAKAMEEAVMERYRGILDAREAIDASEQSKELRRAVCPVCGQKTLAGMRYCGCCGAEIG